MKHLSHLFIFLWGVCALWSYLYPLSRSVNPCLCPHRTILCMGAMSTASTQPPPPTITHPPSTEKASWVRNFLKWTYHTSILVASVPWSFDFFFFFSFLKNKLPDHLTHIIYFVSAANRGTTAGSSGDEIGKALASVSFFLFVILFFF